MLTKFLSDFTDAKGVALWIALDIGGTLTKVICVIPRSLECQFVDLEDKATPLIPTEYVMNSLKIKRGLESYDSSELCVKTYLFSSREIPLLLSNLRRIVTSYNPTSPPHIRVTGGGALNYAEVIKEELGVSIDKVEEMTSLISGLSFFLGLPNCSFRYNVESGTTEPEVVDNVYPLLLVNIGSGVSIIRVDSNDHYRRVSGTAVGGGTALGLAKLLIGCESFDELIDLSLKGNAGLADVSVGELLGDDNRRRSSWFKNQMIDKETLAVSLGKLSKQDHQAQREDVAQAILRMVSYNVGYVAYLIAKRENIQRIFFSGKFVHKHPPAMEAIAHAVEFYRRGCDDDEDASHSIERPLDASFLYHEGFLGAAGALIIS